MSFDTLHQFADALHKAGELRRVTHPVDTHLELTEIADRVMKSPGGGPALLFENLRTSRVVSADPSGALRTREVARRHRVPLLINAFGSRARMKMALGADSIAGVTEDFLALLEPKGSLGFLDKLKMLPKLKQLNDLFPVEVAAGRAPVLRHAVAEPSFDLLPAAHCWPEDGGRYITLPMVHTRDPRRDGAPNIGMYRLQIFDAKTCGMHWHLHKGGADHLREAKRLGALPGATPAGDGAGAGAGAIPPGTLPVAIVMGCGPCEIFSAACPLPPDVPEMLFAGLLRKAPVRVTRAPVTGLLVPADADILLEGYVDFDETRMEGPFGDHTGYYSLADRYPVFHLVAMTTRLPLEPPVEGGAAGGAAAGTGMGGNLSAAASGPLPDTLIYPHTIVGIPPMEDAWIGEAIEQLFLPIMKKQLPEVIDMHMPPEGVFHNLMILSIRKAYPGHARKVMHAIWGLGQAMFTKLIVVVDADVDIRNPRETLWRALNSVDYGRDVEIVKGPVDDLDHASQMLRYGGKMGIDATTKWAGEGHTREWPGIIRMDADVKARVDGLWGALGL